MSPRRRGPPRDAAVFILLVISHFALRGLVGEPRVAPDFLLLALLVYSIRTTPGRAAIAGFLVGLLSDALTPVAFGSSAFAHTVVGYLAAWGKAVFFAENLLVSAGFFFGGAWVRDLLVLLAGGHMRGSALAWQLAFWSPINAAATALSGLFILVLFRRWLEVRLAE